MLDPNTLIEKEILVSGKKGRQIKGIYKSNPPKLSYIDTFFRWKTENTFDIVLQTDDPLLLQTYDQILSTFKFTDQKIPKISKEKAIKLIKAMLETEEFIKENPQYIIDMVLEDEKTWYTKVQKAHNAKESWFYLINVDKNSGEVTFVTP